MTTLPLSELVEVTTTISPSGAVRPDFGRTLLVTTDPSLRPPARAKAYNTITTVGEDFVTTSTAYLSARTYFSQSPYPKPLVIGRWILTASGGRLTGGAPEALTTLQAITAGTFAFQGETFTTVNLSLATSFSDVAATLQAALRAGSAASLGDAVVVYVGNVFRIDLGLDGTNTPYEVAAAFTGTNAGDLGLDAASGATILAGYTADADITAAFDAIRLADDTFYWAAADQGITADADLLALSRAVQASGRGQAGIDDTTAGALTANETTSLSAQLFALSLERSFTVWSAQRDNKALSISALMSSVNFNGAQTLINPNGKALPSTTPDSIAQSGVDELKRKRVNYYARYGPGNIAIFRDGRTGTTWMDVRYFLDWLVNDIQTRVFDGIIRHPTRVALSDPGVAATIVQVQRACQQGVQNGGIYPGSVSEVMANSIRTTTGNLDFDGVLTQGYLVYADPVSALTASQRASRTAPTITCWIRGSEAINRVEVSLVFA